MVEGIDFIITFGKTKIERNSYCMVRVLSTRMLMYVFLEMAKLNKTDAFHNRVRSYRL